MQVVAWGFFVVFSAMELQETELDRDSWTNVTDLGFGVVSEPAASYYEPSIRSDFSVQGFCQLLQRMGVSL